MASTQTSSTEKLISACSGAIVTSLMVTPMDVVKMRMQTHQYTPKRTICCQGIAPCALTHNFQHVAKKRPQRLATYQVANMHECALTQKNPLPFKGTLDGLYKITKYEGLTALWRGLSPALIMSVPANVIYFVGYDYLRDYIKPMTQTAQSDYSPLVAGALARTVAVTIISPIELFRTRLQATANTNFKNVLEGIVAMVMKDGVYSLWRGLTPTLWRDVPFSAIYWMGYEECKTRIQPFTQGELETAFLSGALSGMFAAAITTPFDVAKTQRQVDAGKDKSSLKDSRVPAILKQIYKQQGVAGLFRGISPRVAKIGPSCAIMISSYEMGKLFFAKQHT